jgi:hypothetical protein
MDEEEDEKSGMTKETRFMCSICFMLLGAIAFALGGTEVAIMNVLVAIWFKVE